MDNNADNLMPKFHNLLVIDIETVPVVADFNDLDKHTQEQWLIKFDKINKDINASPDELFAERGGIYAEFGKIVCIGIGYFTGSNYTTIRLKSIYDDDEAKLLQDFFAIIKKMNLASPIKFCGHNIKEFDLPFICRRALVHRIPLPSCLQLSMMKPWQNPHLDTLELWRFGDYKHYITLDLLAHTLGVPSSKSDINGKDVAKVYYINKNLKRIAKYCLNDVYTTALIFLRLQELPYQEVEPIFVT